MKRATVAVVCSALLLGACASGRLKDTGPKIRTLGERKAPATEELPIVLSEPVQANAELALRNYQEILKLAPDEATRAEAMRRMADLQIDLQDVSPDGNNDRLSSSIRLYEQLLAENPQDPKNYRVLYQLARAYQNAGQEAKATEVLARLAQEFPDLDIAHEGRFRRADLLFRLRRYDEAAVEYEFVSELGDTTPFYEQSLHMLAWSHYKLGNHDKVLDVEFRVLEAELPPGELIDPVSAIAQVRPAQRDLVQDALRVTSLSLMAQGGGQAVDRAVAARGEPRFFILLYNVVGQALLERERYTDAAATYEAFRSRYALHPLAPQFQTQVIATLETGGFGGQVVIEKEQYARLYDPAADYWGGRAPTDVVMRTLRTHLEDLARARGGSGPEQGAEEYLAAAGWYRRLLEVFPDDAEAPELNFLLGDALLDGGDTQAAALAYTATAYDYPVHDRSAEAAYAAVLAYQKRVGQLPPESTREATRTAIDASVRMVDTYPDHPQAMAVLTRASEDLFAIEEFDEAITVARRVAQAVPPATPELQRTVWAVIADAQYTQKRYALAENAYEQLLIRTPDDPEERVQIGERLAETIYRQAENAREAGEARVAIGHFLRLGQVVPNASIRPNAEYDAAGVLIGLEDWAEAARVLEDFRARFPAHELNADADKQLARVYEQSDRPAAAAGAYSRIARRATETPATRQAAAWRSGELYDEAADLGQAATAWAFYANNFPSPLDDAMDARARLVELAEARGDDAARLSWHRQIVEADRAAGSARTERSRSLAAVGALALGRDAAQTAKRIALTLPVERSLPVKRNAIKSAIQWLDQAAGYGYAEITTAATWELGDLYRDFARDLMDSQRPANLDELALEQYELLLEEQAFPFEEQAIDYHETNLKRIANGVYDDWVAQSYEALLKLLPARYGRDPLVERVYESLD